MIGGDIRDVTTQLTMRWATLREGVARLPSEARAVLYCGFGFCLLMTALLLSSIFGWWIDSALEISASKPRISRLLGYIEAGPQIDQTLTEIELALSRIAIEDTGDTGRGGALLQQQLRQLAGDVGLTVVGSEVKEPKELDSLVKLNVTLQVTGGPDNFDEFFQRLYRASPALFPEAMTVEALRRINRRRQPSTLRGTEDHVSARVDIASYRLGSPGA